MRRILFSSLLLSITALGCGDNSSSTACAVADYNCDGVPDDLGTAVQDSNGNWAQADLNGDGVGDGLGVDTDGDGFPDAVILDTDGDGLGDSLDFDLDGVADQTTGTAPGGATPGAGGTAAAGTGGGDPGTGTGGTAAPGAGGTLELDQGGGCLLGKPATSTSKGTTSNRWHKQDVSRNGVNYKFMANGWGENWRSHSISWDGTGMAINSYNGSKQNDGAPAGYPAVFCGAYSGETSGACGLPRAVSSISSLETGLSWSHPAGTGSYNVSYDVWLGNSGHHSGFFMVWLRDPPGETPAQRIVKNGVTVANVTGQWDIWTGTIEGKPIINYVRREGGDSHELAFDLKDFFNDLPNQGLTLPGSEVLSVAVGFEIWEGGMTGLKIDDFCVDVK